MRKKLIIHAGFPKCASTSIQRFLNNRAQDLNSSSVAVIGDRFTYGSGKIGSPIWFLEEKRKGGEKLAELLENAIMKGSESFDKYIISSENLNGERFAELFQGIDRSFDVSVVFYIRPQQSWLISAWKQFEISRGKDLSTFLDQAINRSYPRFLKQICEWEQNLPEAKIIVKPLHSKYLFGGSPVTDFCKVSEIEGFDYDEVRVNQSFDYSLLHLLKENSHVFGGQKKTNWLFKKLSLVIPSEYQKTNIDMVNREYQERIE